MLAVNKTAIGGATGAGISHVPVFPQVKEITAVKSFSEVLEAVRKSLDASGLGLQDGFAGFEAKVKSGAVIPAQELLLYQIKAAQFGLGVELVSKLAESALATVRKFQNPQ